MFQMMLFVGSVIALVLGALVVLIGIGAITGCAGGLIVMCAGGAIALVALFSTINFLLPAPEGTPVPVGAISLIKKNGRWS